MAGGFEVIEDNTNQVQAAIKSALDNGLNEVGLVAEGYAKALCPVDTGRLRDSITHQVESGERAVYIGTNVEYAVYVEFREDVTHATGQAHFLRDAATNNASEYQKIIENALRDG